MMSCDEKGIPAGAGRAAAAYLQEMETSMQPSSPSVPKVPQPPPGPCPGRTRPARKHLDEKQDEFCDEWLWLFQKLAKEGGCAPSEALLTQCASLAAEVKHKVLQLNAAASKAGLDANAISSVSKKLLDHCTESNHETDIPPPNPQDAEKAESRPMRRCRKSMIDVPGAVLSANASAIADDSELQKMQDAGEGEILTTKYAYLRDAGGQREQRKNGPAGEKHPLHEAMVDKMGDVDLVKSILEKQHVDLQASLHEAQKMPCPLLYAVTSLQSPGICKLLLLHRADPSVRFGSISNAGGMALQGLTPLQAVKLSGGMLASDCRTRAIYDLLLGADLLQEGRQPMVRSLTIAVSAGRCAASSFKLDHAATTPNRGPRESLLAKAEAALAREKEGDAAGGEEISRRKSRRASMPAMGDAAKLEQPSTVVQLFFCKHLDGSPKEVYELDVQVGEGTFGSVRKAKHKQTGQIHAVKTCPKKLIAPSELWAEIEIMKQLDHPHVMRIYHTFEDDLCVYIASEICEGGELFDALIKTGCMSEQIASKLFKQIMSAVAYIHCNSICHRDLKPENFLLARQCELIDARVKLIDFGTAKRFDLAPMTTKVCTVHYVAPEVLKKSMDPYTEKVDVWSCGVILYLMLSGSAPFSSDDDLELMKMVKKGKWAFQPAKLWSSVTDEAKDLVTSMLTKDPDARVSSQHALANEWLHRQDMLRDHVISENTIKQMRAFVAQTRLKKVALQIIARQVSDDTIEQLRCIFLSVDTDNSGTLTVQEMDEALVRLQAEDSIRLEMRRLMHDIDVDGNGTINYTEFLAATISQNQYLQEEVCRAAFHIFDVDGDGFISKNDLATLLHSSEQEGFAGINLEEIQDIMAEVDANGDGYMSWLEFMDLMKTSQITRMGSNAAGSTEN